MIAAVQPIGPRHVTHSIRGESVTFTAMDDAQRIDWWKIQTFCCMDRVRAAELARRGREADLDKILKLLVTADYSLVRRATGWPLEKVAAYTVEERAAIIAIQDQLNGTAQLAPLLQPFAEQAYLSIGV